MRMLGTYLWKEWRDHRAVLVGMVLAVPLLLVVMSLSLPWSLFDREHFSAYASVACLAMFVVSLATDLVPGEARRGHRWLLERLPGGLAATFRGKLVFFAVGAAFFAAYGYLGGAVTCRLVTGQWPPAPSPGAGTGVVAVLALWVFAVSCSLPRGALSLPAFATLALLLALPLLACWQIDPWGEPQAWWRSAPSTVFLGFGAVVAGWVAFRRTGFPRSGSACLAVAALCATPYWADAAHDAYRWDRHSVIVIFDGYVGEGGRYAFLDRARVHPDVPHHQHRMALPPVIVDLETGTAREVDGTAWSASGPEGCPQRYVRLWGGGSFDARTAEPAQPTQEELREAARAATPHRVADGRRAWVFDSRLEAAADGGAVEILEERWAYCSAEGLGFEFGRFVFDPWRGRRYDRGMLGLKGYYGLRIRPGRWLVRKGETSELFDPDARTLAPILAPHDVRCGTLILDDGRVTGARGGQLVLLDPETGAVTDVPLPPGTWLCDPFGRPRRTPAGRRVFHVWDGTRSAFARFDPTTGTLAKTATLDGWATLLGCATDDAAIVKHAVALWRLPFGSDEREEIWRVR